MRGKLFVKKIATSRCCSKPDASVACVRRSVFRHLSRTFPKQFLLCDGVRIVSGHRYCQLPSTATERCDDTKDPAGTTDKEKHPRKSEFPTAFLRHEPAMFVPYNFKKDKKEEYENKTF